MDDNGISSKIEESLEFEIAYKILCVLPLHLQDVFCTFVFFKQMFSFQLVLLTIPELNNVNRFKM